MSIWDNYKREETNRLGPGDYRVVIENVEETQSKKFKDMLVITIRPSGTNLKLKYYLVFGTDYTNRNLTDLIDSFSLDEGSNLLAWVGAMGGARLVEDDNGYLKVKFFLSPEKTDKLPPWEGPLPERQTVDEGFTAVDDEEAPF